MEGVKCPICKAISIMNGLEDGEMVDCMYCQARFTVTPLRRYDILSKENEKYYNNRKREQEMENFVRKLADDKLLQFVNLITDELIKRSKRKEKIGL